MDKCLLHALMVGEEWEHGGKMVGRWWECDGKAIGIEAKGDYWKMAYRAGKESVEAARAFAEQWLAEIG